VQSAFPIVVFGAVAFSVLMSLAFLFLHGGLYDRIGEGGLTSEHDAHGGAPMPLTDTPASRAERELEIRQMLKARSERRLRRGEPALDIEAEVARLLADEPPATHDAGLEEEVRQLVVARNERRGRRGLEPLDVDAEVERTLAELDA
jgi:hypothetical protein